MTKEFVKGVAYSELDRAYSAYSELISVYENTCGGVYAARNYKEYFALCDSRNNIRREVLNRVGEDSHGE